MQTTWTRRELLAGFLGASFALPGCQPAAGEPTPPGELVGASVDVGHRLREGLRLEIPADQEYAAPVVIVGGGIAGLSAAWALRNAGCEDFLLLELEQTPGGTSRSGQKPVCKMPWGAHYVPAPTQDNPDLVALFEEMQLFEQQPDSKGDPIVREEFLCRDPQERIFYKGNWYEGLYLHAGASAEDRRQFTEFRQQIDRWIDPQKRGQRAFRIPAALSPQDDEAVALDRISMAQWLDQHHWDSPRLRWLVDYACRDDYGMRMEQVSAWAGVFYFASRKEGPGQSSRPFITWPEGNGRIVEHLRRPIRRQTWLGWAAAEIDPTIRDDRREIEIKAVSYDGEQARRIRAQRVIFAAPQFLARYLIKPYRRNPPPHLEGFQYGAWMTANLLLDGSPDPPKTSLGFPLCWDNVLYDSPSLGYVSATHQRGLDYGPQVWTYYYPLCDEDGDEARKRLLSLGREDWAEVVLADLSRPHPEIRKHVQQIDVMRWGHAMIRPRTGWVWSGDREKAAEPFQGVHFAHSDLSGVALFEEAFHHGVRAAKEVLQSLPGLNKRQI